MDKIDAADGANFGMIERYAWKSLGNGVTMGHYGLLFKNVPVKIKSTSSYNAFRMMSAHAEEFRVVSEETHPWVCHAK